MDRVTFSQYSGIFRADLSHSVIAEGAVGHFPVGGEKQEGAHILPPALAVQFVDHRQLPQVMRIVQAVEAAIFPVGCPANMDIGSLQSGQNAKSDESLLARAGMNAYPGQGFCRCRVLPVGFARDPHADLIKMSHACFPGSVHNTRDGGGA
jgi:hypothetical protein